MKLEDIIEIETICDSFSIGLSAEKQTCAVTILDNLPNVNYGGLDDINQALSTISLIPIIRCNLHNPEIYYYISGSIVVSDQTDYRVGQVHAQVGMANDLGEPLEDNYSFKWTFEHTSIKSLVAKELCAIPITIKSKLTHQFDVTITCDVQGESISAKKIIEVRVKRLYTGKKDLESIHSTLQYKGAAKSWNDYFHVDTRNEMAILNEMERIKNANKQNISEHAEQLRGCNF